MRLARSFCVGLLVATAPAAALAQANVCQRLETALYSLDRGADSGAARQNQLAKMRGDLDRLSSQARSMGCDAPRGFLIFQGPPRPPECDQIDDQVSRLRSSIASAERGGGDTDGQRRQILAALVQNNCGPQYRAMIQAAQPAQPQQPQRPRGFFEQLFGGPAQSEPEEAAPGLDVAPLQDQSQYAGGSHTVCVRTCDGYFFPLSNASGPAKFSSDEALCRRLCPASEVQLFTYRGDDIRYASDINGRGYMSLANALRYRKELVPSCSCRAPGQSWAQALAGIEDKTTLQKGDILVTEEQAREMSQPRFADPAQGAKGKADAKAAGASSAGASSAGASSADTSAAAAGQGSAGATTAAPLAPAAEQPGQRAVRVITIKRPASEGQQAQ